MSMLVRFRRPGGVQQLVSLLESCLSKKRETLLKTICQEDEVFGEMIKSKLLTVEKIFTWDPLVISEVTTLVGERNLAISLIGLPKEFFDIATHTLNVIKKRDMKNLIETLKPTSVEIETAQIKLVEKARQVQKQGNLKIDDDDDAFEVA